MRAVPVTTDSPKLAAAKQLMDRAVSNGFRFERIAPGPDAPLRAVRDSLDWIDEIYVGGFSDSCTAIRRRRFSLIVPGGLPIADRVDGDALTVLYTVVTEWII